jgi:hypothetical protein
MAVIIVPSRRLIRPTGQAQVNPRHPLAPSFYASMSPADGTTVYRDADISAGSIAWSGTPSYDYTRSGHAFYKGNGTTYLDIGVAPVTSGTQPFTIASYGLPSAASNYYGIATWKAPGATYRFVLARADISRAPYCLFIGPTSGASVTASDQQYLQTNVEERLLITAAGGSNSTTGSDFKFYVNSAAERTFNTTASLSSDTNNYNRIGHYGANQGFTGWFGDVAIWPRVLTAAEIAEYYNAPWQFLGAVQKRRFFDFGVTSTTTNASIAATDGADVIAINAEVTTGATLGVTDGADTVVISTTVTTGATLAPTDGADVIAITAANWTTAQIAAADGADTVAINATVTTGATLGIADGADVIVITADANVATTSATIAMADGADTIAIGAEVTTGATLAVTDGADTVAINATVTTGAAIAATDGDDAISIIANAGQEAGGWRGHGGEWEDRPWWADVPTKPLPKKVEKAIESAAKVPPLRSQQVLAKKLEAAEVEWSEDYDALLSLMYEREAATLAELRAQAVQAKAKPPARRVSVTITLDAGDDGLADIVAGLRRQIAQSLTGADVAVNIQTVVNDQMIARENDEMLLVLLM